MATLLCWTLAVALVVPAVLFARLDLEPAGVRKAFAWSLPLVAVVLAVVATVAERSQAGVSEDELFAATERASWHMPGYNDALGLSDRVFAELGEEVDADRVAQDGEAKRQQWEVSADDAVVCVLVETSAGYATPYREAAVSVTRGACEPLDQS